VGPPIATQFHGELRSAPATLLTRTLGPDVDGGAAYSRRRLTVVRGTKRAPVACRARALSGRADAPVAWWGRLVGSRRDRAGWDPLGAGPPSTSLVRCSHFTPWSW